MSEASRVTCDGCGRQVDPDDVSLLDCQPYALGDPGWRRVAVCAACFDRLDPDVWISRRCWESISPAVPFDRLPPPPAPEPG